MSKYKNYTNQNLIKKYLELSQELKEVKEEIRKRIEKNGKIVTPIGIAQFTTIKKYEYNTKEIVNWLKRHSINWSDYITIDMRKVKPFIEEWKTTNLLKIRESIRKQIIVKKEDK